MGTLIVELFPELCGTLLRSVLMSLSAYLVAHHVATSDQAHRLTDELATHAAMAAPFVVAFGWSIVQKYRSRVKFLTGLQMPPNTSEAAVLAQISKGFGAKLTGTASMLLLAVLLGAGVIALPACAGHTPIQTTTIAETAAVQAVHAVVTAEASAFQAGAYDRATHDKYLHALRDVLTAERALNDALLAWAKTQGAPMPAAVVQAVKALSTVLKDLQPLILKNSAAGALAATIITAIETLTTTGG